MSNNGHHFNRSSAEAPILRAEHVSQALYRRAGQGPGRCQPGDLPRRVRLDHGP